MKDGAGLLGSCYSFGLYKMELYCLVAIVLVEVADCLVDFLAYDPIHLDRGVSQLGCLVVGTLIGMNLDGCFDNFYNFDCVNLSSPHRFCCFCVCDNCC